MNKLTKNILILVVLVLVIWGGVRFFGDKEPQINEPIKIGVISILSGQYTMPGENFVRGIELAKEQYLTENPEMEIKLIIEDDKFDAVEGLNAYKKMTEFDQVDALINVSSPTINAIYDLVTATDLPLIQGGEQSKDATEDNIFQIMPGGHSALVMMGQYLKSLNLENPILLYANEATYKRFADITLENYGEMKNQSIDLSLIDYRTEIAKILADEPSDVIFMMTPEKGALLVKQMIEVADKVPNLIFDASFETGREEYKKIFGDFSKLEGSLVIYPEKLITDEIFINNYENKYGEKPGIAADWGYDAFMTLITTRDKDNKKWGISGLRIKINKKRTPQPLEAFVFVYLKGFMLYFT